MKVTEENLTKEIETWWDKNPFNYGVINKDRDQIGRPVGDVLTREYFEAIERRFRKHTTTVAQASDAELLSNFIDYKWLFGKRALDIACGSGVLTVALARGGAKVTAIDLTGFGVRETKKNLEFQGLEAEALQMDAQKLLFTDASFDFVNAWGCLMHMPRTEGAISEIYRVLKPSGRFLAYMYNKNSFTYWFNFFFMRGILGGYLLWYFGDTTRLVSRFSDGASVGGNILTKVYTPKEVRRMFYRIGFSKVRVFPFGRASNMDSLPFRPFPLFKFLPKVVKTYLAKRFDWGLIIIAEK